MHVPINDEKREREKFSAFLVPFGTGTTTGTGKINNLHGNR